MTDSRVRRCYVYAIQNKGQAMMLLAYTAYEREGACVHDVVADTRARAIAAAMREHRTQCLPVAERVVTHPDGHNAYLSPGRTVERVPCDCPMTVLPVPPGRRLVEEVQRDA